ncbi:MAG TPA: SMI1/KNR4 family protein [Myxococcaceae bacterium]|nr:SMI1/KNR4 family protein [Myxococcaceae bacterium]
MHHPQPAATEDAIAAFEQAHGFQLDDELRAFYRATNGAKLFREFDSPYWIFPLERIIPASVAVYGPEAETPHGTANVFALCDVLDGNYAGFAVTSPMPYPIYDIFHEAWHLPEHRKVIAASFGEFLARALRSGGFSYWLGGPPVSPP